MDKLIHIPANIDFDDLINKNVTNYPVKEHGVTSEGLAYICHCIIQMKLYYKENYFKTNFKTGYYPLCSASLRKVNYNYNHCIQFLKANKIIYCDGYFIKDKKCYGYKLASQFIENGFGDFKVSPERKRAINQHEESIEAGDPFVSNLLESRRHLLEFLKSPLLTIDADAANKDIDANYTRNKFKEKWDNRDGYFDADVVYDQIEENAVIFKFLIQLINNKNFKVVIDSSGHRLHSPITRLPKFLRKYLQYNGKSLVSLDLKNSQPYFSLLLLEETFYTTKKQKKGGINLLGIDAELYELLNKVGINWPSKGVITSAIQAHTTIILQKILETLAGAENLTFKNYRDDAVQGSIYENFLNVQVDDPYFKEERKFLKQRFIELMFDKPNNSQLSTLVCEKYNGPFRIFNLIKSVHSGKPHKRRRIRERRRKNRQNNKLEKNLADQINTDYEAKHVQRQLIKYPSPILVKKGANKPDRAEMFIDNGYAKFATLLQRIESYLLLDVICKSINKQYPEIPLITVHDCICCVPEYVEYVESVIKERLTEYVGYPPTLEKESWSPKMIEETKQPLILIKAV